MKSHDHYRTHNTKASTNLVSSIVENNTAWIRCSKHHLTYLKFTTRALGEFESITLNVVLCIVDRHNLGRFVGKLLTACWTFFQISKHGISSVFWYVRFSILTMGTFSTIFKFPKLYAYQNMISPPPKINWMPSGAMSRNVGHIPRWSKMLELQRHEIGYI